MRGRATALEGERIQHPGRIAPKTSVAVGHKVERIGVYLPGQGYCLLDKRLECRPAAMCGDGFSQFLFILLRRNKGCANAGEGFQGFADGGAAILQLRIPLSLGCTKELADDPVVGLDDGVGNQRLPFERTDRKNGKLPVLGQIAEPVCEVALTLTAQTGDAMGRYAVKDAGFNLA
jgi:hypothetical protein